VICLAAGLGPGDEVVVPSLTFVATANAIRYTGATPVFADIVALDRPWLSAEAAQAAIAPKTKAIMNMTYAGHPGESGELAELAAERDLVLLEDAAHGLGGKIGERHLGTLGKAGAFSFFSNKNLPVGEGGMVVTDDDEVAAEVKLLRSHGMTSLTWDRHKGHASTYDVVELGFNYRIDEPRATLALARLGRLDDALARLREVAGSYREGLARVEGVEVPFPAEWVELAGHFAFPVLVADLDTRNRVRETMHANGVQTTFYPALTQLTEYQGAAGDGGAPVAEEVADRHLALPLSPSLGDEEIGIVVEEFRAAVTAKG
jgi:dTDP-4-amino-4,6-dideoxygalactose transaminase